VLPNICGPSVCDFLLVTDGAWNCEVAVRFLEHLCNPMLTYNLHSCFLPEDETHVYFLVLSFLKVSAYTMNAQWGGRILPGDVSSFETAFQILVTVCICASILKVM
jgi:hypothetical protein